MNILLFNNAELSSGGELELCDSRARHLLEVQSVKVGDSLRVGELGGGVGAATVLRAEPGNVVLRPGSLKITASPPPTDLVIALPRPQILKKILQISAMMGVRRMMLIRSAEVVKSYFSSSLLAPDKIREQLLLGLEQGTHTRLPEVTIHPRFRMFVEGELSGMVDPNSQSLVAHPAAPHDIAELGLQSSLTLTQAAVLAIGPESGWRPHEIDAFLSCGFRQFNCGRAVLRVDTAVPALLGQIDLLRKLD